MQCFPLAIGVFTEYYQVYRILFGNESSICVCNLHIAGSSLNPLSGPVTSIKSKMNSLRIHSFVTLMKILNIL